MAAPGSEADDDPLREARAYNDSILFMVAVPYILLASCAAALFVLYRKKVKLEMLFAQKASAEQSLDAVGSFTAAARL